MANVLLDILRDCCKHASYRTDTLPKLIQWHESRLSVNWRNHIRYPPLLQSPWVGGPGDG